MNVLGIDCKSLKWWGVELDWTHASNKGEVIPRKFIIGENLVSKNLVGTKCIQPM